MSSTSTITGRTIFDRSDAVSPVVATAATVDGHWFALPVPVAAMPAAHTSVSSVSVGSRAASGRQRH